MDTNVDTTAYAQLLELMDHPVVAANEEEAKALTVFNAAMHDRNYKVAHEYALKVLPFVSALLEHTQNQKNLLQQIIDSPEPKPILQMHKCVKHSYKDPSSCLCRGCMYLCATDDTEDAKFVCNCADQVTNAIDKEYPLEEIINAFEVDPDGFCKMYVDRGYEEVPTIDDLTVDEPEETSEEEQPDEDQNSEQQ